MEVTLTDDEARAPRALLQDYLAGLRFEAARTHGADANLRSGTGRPPVLRNRWQLPGRWPGASIATHKSMVNVILIDEAQTLVGILQGYFHGLKFEIARTDSRELRDALLQRQALRERLLADASTQQLS